MGGGGMGSRVGGGMRWVALVLVVSAAGGEDAAGGGGGGDEQHLSDPTAGEMGLRLEGDQNTCVETAADTPESDPRDRAACRRVAALEDEDACLAVVKADRSQPGVSACTFKVSSLDPKNCDSGKGGWVEFDWIGDFEPICVAEFALLCVAGTILLFFLCAWAVCNHRGIGHFAHHVRFACVPSAHRAPCARLKNNARARCLSSQAGALDGGASSPENARLAKQLEAERMTRKWPSPMQPSTPSALTLIDRIRSTGNASGMFPARCVRLMAAKKDYDAEVLGFNDGNDRAEVVLEHLAAEGFHITIAVGDVVIVENRSDSHWWQGYVEKKVEDRQELASTGDGSSYIEAVRNARRLRLQAKTGTPALQPERKRKRKLDTGIRIFAHAGKTGVMSIRAIVPSVWCSAPKVRWYRLQHDDVPAQRRFAEGQIESSEIGSGLTYQVQKEDHGLFIGCSLSCGCKRSDPSGEPNTVDEIVLEVDGTSRSDSVCEHGDTCHAPLHLLEANCLCRDGWLGLGLYGRDGMAAKDPYDLVPKGARQSATGA